MAQKPVLRGEVRCACVAREVSVEADWNKGDTSSSAQSSSLSTLPGGAVWALSVAPRDSLTAAAEKCVEECMLNRDGTIRGGGGGGAAIIIAAAPLFLGLAPFGVTAFFRALNSFFILTSHLSFSCTLSKYLVASGRRE